MVRNEGQPSAVQNVMDVKMQNLEHLEDPGDILTAVGHAFVLVFVEDNECSGVANLREGT